MQLFSYTAKSQIGRTVKGQVEARDISQAAWLLRQKKLVVVYLKPVKKSLFSAVSLFFRRVRSSDIVLVTRQLSTMIAAGLPITDALRILQAQTRSGMSGVLSEILADIEGGSSLTDALEKRRKIFSPVYISLVRAGESAGVLDNILTRLADNLERQKEFNGKIKSAMIYPTIVLIGMAGVSFIMMAFVVPKLTAMYETFDAKLPLITQVLISVSKIMSQFWIFFIAAVAGLIFLFSGWKKTKRGKYQYDRILFRVPIVGRLRKFVILTEFSRTMGLLVGAGISILDGLKITAEAVGSPVYRDGFLAAARQVEKGLPLAVPISQNPDFPPILGQMINVGEETGKVDEVLTKISNYFASESDQGVTALTAAIEPLIIIFLGVGVGILVAAVIMPIYNLTGAI